MTTIIADIAIWSGMVAQPRQGLRDRAAIFLDVKEYKHLQACMEKMPPGPAVKRLSRI